jgi:uncharacterized protein YndB with AHSA1/START domain
VSRRRLEKHIELDAGPEQVWEAIATGPGIATWFVPHDVEPREGGTVEQDYGGRGLPPQWLAYVAVDDLDASVSAARGHG